MGGKTSIHLDRQLAPLEVWARLQASHAPDLVLLKTAQENCLFGADTTAALAGSVQRTVGGKRQQEDDLKARLYAEGAHPGDFRRYVECLGGQAAGSGSRLYPLPHGRWNNKPSAAVVGKFNAHSRSPERDITTCSPLLQGLTMEEMEIVQRSLETIKRRVEQKGRRNARAFTR